MQDRYTGDIGDFGKFGLLKSITNQGLTLGINWYLTKTGYFEESIGDGKYRISESCSQCDVDLSEQLRKIFDAKQYPGRSVDALQKAELVKNTHYYAQVLEPPANKSFSREIWHREALAALKPCDVVFLDPDNGKKARSIGLKSQKSPKYILDIELMDYYSMGHSIIFYNHRSRIAEEAYFQEFDRFLGTKFPDSQWYAMTFKKGTLRDYFIIPQERHAKAIESALVDMMGSMWNTVFTRQK